LGKRGTIGRFMFYLLPGRPKVAEDCEGNNIVLAAVRASDDSGPLCTEINVFLVVRNVADFSWLISVEF
jgi:hypothetical protein